MADPVEAARIFNEAQDRPRRTIVPGRVGNVTRQENRERDADFSGGIADLMAGEADPGTPSPDAPVLTIGGGGFFMLLPVTAQDEAVGFTSDRALDEWRATREVGTAPTFERIKDDSDIMIAPLMITAPDGAPATWSGLALGGPAGVAFELTTDGPVTITKQGTPVATISLNGAGSITFEVATGQSVNGGGPGAVELAKAQIIQALKTAFQAAITAAAPVVPPNGDGGTLGFTALLQTFNGLSAGNVLQTLKMKGE